MKLITSLVLKMEIMDVKDFKTEACEFVETYNDENKFLEAWTV